MVENKDHNFPLAWYILMGLSELVEANRTQKSAFKSLLP